MTKNYHQFEGEDGWETDLVVFPLGGKQYGFPKRVPNLLAKDLNEWLVEHGYPQEEIDAYGKDFVCRFWEVVSGEDSGDYEGLDTEED